MRLKFLLSFLLLIFKSCAPTSSTDTTLIGKWQVDSVSRYVAQDDKIIETFETERFVATDGMIYDFKYAELTSISMNPNEKPWDFKTVKKDSLLSLININGDAEDDALIFSFEGDKLILIRKMEDADPNDDSKSVFVCDKMYLRKL